MKQFRNTNYYLSEDGKVYRNNKEIKSYTNKKGYKQVILYIDNKRKLFYVHRLIPEVYLNTKSEYSQIIHLDGDKSNNSINNIKLSIRSKISLYTLNKSILNYIIRVSNGNDIYDFNSYQEVSDFFNLKSKNSITYGLKKGYLRGFEIKKIIK